MQIGCLKNNRIPGFGQHNRGSWISMLCLSQVLFRCFIQLRMCHVLLTAAITHDGRIKAGCSLLSFQIRLTCSCFTNLMIGRHRNEPKDQQKQPIKPMATQGGIVFFVFFDPSLLYKLPSYSIFGHYLNPTLQ